MMRRRRRTTTRTRRRTKCDAGKPCCQPPDACPSEPPGFGQAHRVRRWGRRVVAARSAGLRHEAGRQSLLTQACAPCEGCVTKPALTRSALVVVGSAILTNPALTATCQEPFWTSVINHLLSVGVTV